MKNILTKLIASILNLFKPDERMLAKQKGKKKCSLDVAEDMRQKEKDVYGEGELSQQKLYEKWAVKISWHLKTQAIPLLLSIDPEKYFDSDIDEDTKKRYEGLCLHAQQCVEQGLLCVTNKQKSMDEWEATPIDIYKWATISRVKLPKELSALMEFVMMTLVSSVNVQTGTGESRKQAEGCFNSDKEYMLGAALAMLVKHPEKCADKKGRVKAANIVALIGENEASLFGKQASHLSTTTAMDLINKWIKIKS